MDHGQYLTEETMVHRDGWRPGPESEAYARALGMIQAELAHQQYGDLDEVFRDLVVAYKGPVNEIAFIIDRYHKTNKQQLNIK